MDIHIILVEGYLQCFSLSILLVQIPVHSDITMYDIQMDRLLTQFCNVISHSIQTSLEA